ncbi:MULTISPECIES: adenylate kinase [unclassified Nocardioides]|uniref:adenylate kinase n=1 Tax=unclassified Nocardioides TaxID=2615069 RepID=UPI0006FCA489|nr:MULTISPECIES: adenylate kinase [unclassified Nocardioides]KRA38388.1 adenylate kinase [Nocardioides sp. Root614]KRA92347.1 adenylate kinase [Nocardioides sp. Root682]
MRLIIMGPPGAGKGTQARYIAERHGIPAISTGDIFRANVADATLLGLRAQAYMDAGEYVPDEITNAMVRDRLQAADCHDGFLLDGYPRTLDQVAELDRVLARLDARLDGVLLLSADPEELVERLLGRARTEGRADDTESVIRRRLAVYEEQTTPLVAAYEERRLLVAVDGLGLVSEVTDRLQAAVAGLQRATTAF